MHPSATRDALRARRAAPGFAYLMMAGCLGQDTVPPAGATGPEPVTLAAPIQVETEAVLAGTVQFAAPLFDHSVVASQAGMLLRRDVLATDPVEVGATAGPVHAAAVVGGETLVAGREGLFVLVGGALERSPLDEWFEAGAVRRLMAVPDTGDLWLSTETELVLWHDGALSTIQSDGLALADAQLGFGAPIDGEPALWVLAEGTASAWTARPGGFEARPLDLDDVQSMAIDGSGTLWLVASGTLYRRETDGTIVKLAFPEPLRAVFAGIGSPDLWLTDGTGLWHHAAGRTSPVDGAPAGVPIAADELGRLLIASADELARVATGRPTIFLGFSEGDGLEQITVVTLAPALPDQVVTVEAKLGSTDLPVAADPWRVTLDPADLADGDHHLDVSVTYADEQTRVSSLFFHKGAHKPATWDGDIAPLYQSRCNYCHGPDGGAHRLDTAQAWETDIDRILDAVREGLMPRLPPRLTDAEIALIERWRAGGFR